MTQQPGPGHLPVDPTPPGAPLHPGGVPFIPAAVPPPPPEGRWKPAGMEPVPGTEFGLVHLEIAALPSGAATGSLIAGIGSVLVSLLVLCFGLAGAEDSWGGWVAGAFTLLAVLFGLGAVGAGLAARRQIARSGPGRVRFSGRNLAVVGISCGAFGAGIALLALVLALVVQVA